jgi:integrase
MATVAVLCVDICPFLPVIDYFWLWRYLQRPTIAALRMACLYKRDGSKFWWVEYLDVSGKRRQKSTKLRHDVTSESRKAQEFRSELAQAEKFTFNQGEMWEAWVPRLLEQRYAGFTLGRYRNSWKNLSAFLRSHQIHIPRQLSRQQVRNFVAWRQERHTDLGVYEVSKNTALTEIKLLRILMGEAVISGFCTINPCAKLDIRKDPSPKKPRITDAEHAAILRELQKEPEWMRISYEIAWEQGCRFSETCLPLTDVDLKKNTIRFRTKGRKEENDQFPLSPNLRPLFKRLIKEGRSRTFEMPKMPGKAWWLFFKRIKMPHLCFHCTRVTFITRCYEQGVPREMVMRLAGHSSTAAHEIYPRLPAGSDLLQEMRKLI